MVEDKLDTDAVTTEIDKFTDSIYALREVEGDKRKVGGVHIRKKYKGKHEAAAKVINSTLHLFEKAVTVIQLNIWT